MNKQISDLISDLAEEIVPAAAWQRKKCAQCGHLRMRHEDRVGFWSFWYRPSMDGPCSRCDCQRFNFG